MRCKHLAKDSYMNDRKNGIVKWFNDTKGYGFIASEGRDLFVHYKSINSGGFKTLKEGQHITFKLGKSSKGDVAEDVQV